MLVKSVPAQPLNESVFLSVGTPTINDKGEIVFCGNLSGKLGIYKYQDDEIIPLVLAGDSVPGVESTIEKFNCITSRLLSFNNNGELAFSATLSDERIGLFILRGKILELIALEGDLFPDLIGNETLLLVAADSPIINDMGEIAFRSTYYTDITQETFAQGIFLFRDGKIIPIKLAGQKFPDTNGKVFWKFQSPFHTVGNNSEVLYWASYLTPGKEIPGTSIGTKNGLFLWPDGITKPLILTRDQVPGIKDIYKNISNGLNQNSVNDFGETVSGFGSFLNQTGVMLFSNDRAIPVVLGKNLSLDTTLTFIRFASINSNGDIVFYGEDDSRNQGIFLAKKENIHLGIKSIRPDKGKKIRQY